MFRPWETIRWEHQTAGCSEGERASVCYITSYLPLGRFAKPSLWSRNGARLEASLSRLMPASLPLVCIAVEQNTLIISQIESTPGESEVVVVAAVSLCHVLHNTCDLKSISAWRKILVKYSVTSVVFLFPSSFVKWIYYIKRCWFECVCVCVCVFNV
jgi:hypothetical protein